MNFRNITPLKRQPKNELLKRKSQL